MKENRKFGALSSSADPTQLSATISGAILTFSAVIILIAGKLGVPLTESNVAIFAEQVGLAGGSLWFLYGLIRKIVVRFSAKEL